MAGPAVGDVDVGEASMVVGGRSVCDVKGPPRRKSLPRVVVLGRKEVVPAL